MGGAPQVKPNGDRIQQPPEETRTNLSKATVGQRFTGLSSAIGGKVLSLLPVPDRHLNTMFGIAIAVAALMLFTMPIYFDDTTDVDTQTPREARYRVDINCRRWAEFANLPSIGEKTAQAIVKHGQAIGGFRSVDQLIEVKGVGVKTLNKITPFLVNGRQTEAPLENLPPNHSGRADQPSADIAPAEGR